MTAAHPTGLARDELKDGYATLVDLSGAKVLLVRLGDEVRALSAWCTHLRTLIGEQPVDGDGLVECPLHGALFDSSDGSLQLGPTCDALPVHRVEIDSDGGVAVALVGEDAHPNEQRTSSFGSWGATGS